MISNQIPKKGDVYKHSKTGNLYVVVGTSHDSSEQTKNVIVRYDALDDSKKAAVLTETDDYCRPLDDFLKEVTIEGEKVPRFVLDKTTF